MHETIPLLRDLVVIIAIAIPVVALMHRWRIPAIVGFLVAGIAIGPGSFGLLPSPGAGPGLAGAAGQAMTALAVVVVLTVGGRYVVPWLLERIVALRIPEIFTLSIVAICLGAAFITSSVGLSLALGAFLVGLIISES